MDLYELGRICGNRPEVKSVAFSDDGLEIVVRSKITLFDPWMVDHMLNNLHMDEKIKTVIRRLPEIEQEHKFVSNGKYAWRAKHHPSGAFCGPFMDAGEFEWDIRNALSRNDYEAVVDNMIAETASFNVNDSVKLEWLADWFDKTEL